MDGRPVAPYIEIEVESAQWARTRVSEIAQRTFDLLIANGCRYSPVSKYRRISQLGGLCE